MFEKLKNFLFNRKQEICDERIITNCIKEIPDVRRLVCLTSRELDVLVKEGSVLIDDEDLIIETADVEYEDIPDEDEDVDEDSLFDYDDEARIANK